jgi:NitT/TauT family transport system permease protein
MATELRDTIPTFGQEAAPPEEQQVGLSNWSALTNTGVAKSWGEAALLVAVAVAIIGGIEAICRIWNVPAYTFPKPSAIGDALWNNFRPLYWDHLLVTLQVLALGYLIGATIGILLAAVITQFPFVEKIITPYILLLVTTPMIALVPLLVQKLGFGPTPRIIAVALAAGPMVMINAATGFRRTDLAKIALARSYGASTFQTFAKIRFPLALPMIIVGLMVGAIFGMLTAVGAEFVGSSDGLGTRLAFFSSRIRMADFWAVIVILALMGILIYMFFYWVGKKWASWQA